MKNSKKIQTKNGFPIITGNIFFNGKKQYKNSGNESDHKIKNSKKLEENIIPEKKMMETIVPKIIPNRKELKIIKKIEKPEKSNDNGLIQYANNTLNSTDLIVTIKSGTYEDLFKPINKSHKLNDFIREINQFAEFKIKGYTLTVLKCLAYLKQLKSSGRKYIPNDFEIEEILAAAVLYDLAYQLKKNINTIIIKLEYSGGRNKKFVEFLDEVSTLINRVEYYKIDNNVSDDFEHYDTRIKFLRILKEPKLNNLIDIIIKDIYENQFPSLNNAKNDFEKGIFFLNIIKKLGLRFINSRSNFEWFCYNKTLRKIRNFLSRDKHFVFLKVIEERLQYFKEQENIEKFDINCNLHYLEDNILRLMRQRSKKHEIKK